MSVGAWEEILMMMVDCVRVGGAAFNFRPLETRALRVISRIHSKNTSAFLAGSPPPTVTWLLNGQPQKSIDLDQAFPQAVNSKLVVHNLTRAHQHQRYTCQASNFAKTSVTTNVTVELYRTYICIIFYDSVVYHLSSDLFIIV